MALMRFLIETEKGDVFDYEKDWPSTNIEEAVITFWRLWPNGRGGCVRYPDPEGPAEVIARVTLLGVISSERGIEVGATDFQSVDEGSIPSARSSTRGMSAEELLMFDKHPKVTYITQDRQGNVIYRTKLWMNYTYEGVVFYFRGKAADNPPGVTLGLHFITAAVLRIDPPGGDFRGV